MRECAAAAVRANATADRAVEGSGADQLMPLLLLLLSRGGVPDVLAQIHFAQTYFLINGCAGHDDPRKGELGYILTTFDAACAHLRAAGRAALQPSAPAAHAPAKNTTPLRAGAAKHHSRNPSAPAMLELVTFCQQGDTQTDAEPAEHQSSASDVRPGRWASPFARWRARAPAELTFPSPGRT